MHGVFAKTAKGQAELAARSGALTPRARRVLILVDGKRSVADLDALIQSDSLRNTLGQLEEDGFIEYLVVAAPAPTPPASPPAPVAKAAAAPFSPLPDPPDPRRLRQARQIMSEAIHSFVGGSGTRGLLQRIGAAGSLEELRALYEDWHRLIADSLASPWEVSDLRDKLIRVI